MTDAPDTGNVDSHNTTKDSSELNESATSGGTESGGGDAAPGGPPASAPPEEDVIMATSAANVESGLFSIPNIDDEPDFYIEDGVKYHDCLCFHIPEMAHNLIKFFLFAFNVLFWIISFALILVGIWAVTVNADYGQAIDSITSPSVLLILLGILVFGVSFAGCLGALRENTYLLKAFIGIMGAGLIFQLVVVIVVFVSEGKLESSLNSFFRSAIKKYQDDIDMKNALDYMQYQFECCGGSGPNDWDNNIYFDCESPTVSKCGVPFSCCRGFGSKHNNTQCGFQVRHADGRTPHDKVDIIYIGGCTNRIVVFVQENLNKCAGILLAFFIPQILSMLLAAVFMNQVEDEIEYFKQRDTLIQKGFDPENYLIK